MNGENSKRIEVVVPVSDNDDSLYLRQAYVSCQHGSVDSTAGLGGTILVMSWKGRQATVEVGDLWAAWVATFAPTDADAIRSSLKSRPARKT